MSHGCNLQRTDLIEVRPVCLHCINSGSKDMAAALHHHDDKQQAGSFPLLTK